MDSASLLSAHCYEIRHCEPVFVSDLGAVLLHREFDSGEQVQSKQQTSFVLPYGAIVTVLHSLQCSGMICHAGRSVVFLSRVVC